MQKGVIGHEGVVSAVLENGYKVTITSRSACSACHARGLCSASEMVDKVIEVKDSGPLRYKTGDKVNVNIKESAGMKAVWIVYAVPAIILVTFLLYLQRLGMSELVTGLVILGAIAVYFFVMYLFRGKIGRRIHFTLSPLDPTTNN